MRGRRSSGTGRRRKTRGLAMTRTSVPAYTRRKPARADSVRQRMQQRHLRSAATVPRSGVERAAGNVPCERARRDCDRGDGGRRRSGHGLGIPRCALMMFRSVREAPASAQGFRAPPTRFKRPFVAFVRRITSLARCRSALFEIEVVVHPRLLIEAVVFVAEHPRLNDDVLDAIGVHHPGCVSGYER